jgi:antitoxin PrlF
VKACERRDHCTSLFNVRVAKIKQVRQNRIIFHFGVTVMSTLSVTSKGQVTLRRDLLQYLGIEPGQQIEVNKLAPGVLAIHAKTAQSLDAFVGCLPPPSKALSIEEMNTLLANAWAGQP